MKNFLLYGAVSALFLASCQSSDASKGKTAAKTKTEEVKIDSTHTKPADTKTILARREVPVLCYHQIRNNIATDSKRAHDDIIAPDKFKEHMKIGRAHV